MSHFSKKYIKGIVGAGGGGGSSPPPPAPPTLRPPKLGDLQAISSYNYSESIDLISDGEIDGIVNPEGKYIDNVRLFEGIYLNDVLIRQPIDQNSSQVAFEYSLNFIQEAFENKFYSNGEFIETSASDLQNFNGTNSSGISFSILGSKNAIAESISQTLTNLNNYYNAAASNSQSSIFKQLRLLQAQFNFTSQQEIQTYLLPDFPEKEISDYPFVSLKISFNASLGGSYSYSIDDIFELENDIANQVYFDLEATELQVKKLLSPKRAINLVYFVSKNNEIILKGDVYLFLYQRNGFLLQNGVDAVINNLVGAKILKSFSKFNYANASLEVRNGSDLQKPLSLFNKTYLSTNYGTKLRGPFQKGLPVLTLLNSAFKTAETKFNQNSAAALSGKLSDSDLNVGQSYISTSEYSNYQNLHTFLFRKDDVFEKNVATMMSGGQMYVNSYWSFQNISIQGSVITAQFLNSGLYQYTVTISFDKTTKIFNKNYTFALVGSGSVNTYPFLNDGVTYITTSKDFNSYYLNNTSDIFPVLCRILFDKSRALQGSDDSRPAGNFSDWNKDYIKYIYEPASQVTHTVLNPNVDQAFLTFNISALSDTAQENMTLLKTNGVNEVVEAGSSIPSIIEFIIESGYQNQDGAEEIYLSRTYQVRGLVNSSSPTYIDVGREENSSLINQYSRFILGTENVAQPISLPPAQSNKNRFIRVYRATHESYSSLVRREIYLQGVTEIINVPFSYPYSTICGLKLDARTLSEIPSRSYDARFKKVFVPSNYFPLKANGQDKRYVLSKNIAEFNNLSYSSDDKAIYKGNWDGTFKLAWTDNPVWVLFDILINRRYGLGNFISPSEVNYWELYKIGRYCDAVDSNGVFMGVPADDGGLEPRYAFNGVIADKTNVFESLKSLVACFRGNMFYTNSEINFTNDRLKPIMAFFNSSNVKDGIFNYSNERRDMQYNVVEVTYLDRDDLFKQKIEYVEDPDDIKTRGILRTTAQTFGITSRSHAKRLGEHIIYSTINEDENVAFVAGLETFLCRPGDLIAINDQVKTLKNHVGRILNIDQINNSIYTNVSLKSSDFGPSGLTGEISALIPTGKYQSDDFYDLAKSPSKLNISSIYQTDIPIRVTFQATGTQLIDSSPSINYGSRFFIDTGCSGFPLLNQVRVGTPCSITISNTKQQVYKIQSIKELNINEYEVIASKFDTGKFAEIEQGETGLMQDFFSAFPIGRNTSVTEGNGNLLQNQFKYDLSYPAISILQTGNWDLQNDTADISGAWSLVSGADCYNVELITPKYKSIKQTVTGNSAIFEDQTEVGTFTLKVTARNTGSYPNPISATASKSLSVISYVAPIRTNGIIQRFSIKK